MKYVELLTALRKEGIPFKATLQMLYVLPPKKGPQVLVRPGQGHDGKETLMCYMAQVPNIDAVGIPLEDITLRHVAEYAAVWNATYSDKPLAGYKKVPVLGKDGRPRGFYLVKEDPAC